MKRTLFFALTLLAGCSGSNDTATDEADAIIGKWSVGKIVYHFTDNTSTEEPPTQCDIMTSFTFNTDGTAKLTSFVEGSGGCDLEPDNFDYFLWERSNGNNYRMTIKPSDEPVEQVNIVQVTFLNSSTMFWTGNEIGHLDGKEYNRTESYFDKN